MLGDITVEATVDLEYYRDDVIDALQPDDVEDAVQYLEEWWGFTDVDLLGCLLQDMDSNLLMKKLSEFLDVSSALALWLGRAGPSEPPHWAETATRRSLARTLLVLVLVLCIRVMSAVGCHCNDDANFR